MRRVSIEFVHTKEIYDIVDSGALVVDTSNTYSAGDYLHDGIITFSNVFPEGYDSYIQVVRVDYLEQIRGSGSLVVPNFNLYLFTTVKSSPTVQKNQPFQYSDLFDSGTYPMETGFEEISFTTTNYLYTHSETTSQILETKATKYPQNLIFRNNGTQHLFGIAVANNENTSAYASSARVKFVLYVKLL